MSMQLPKYIIFDMDDTILADSLMSDRCWREVCDRFSSPAWEHLQQHNAGKNPGDSPWVLERWSPKAAGRSELEKLTERGNSGGPLLAWN